MQTFGVSKHHVCQHYCVYWHTYWHGVNMECSNKIHWKFFFSQGRKNELSFSSL
jgi:hypothetical protein